KRRRRVAWRRGKAVGEHLGRDEEVLRRIERAPGADQKVVAVIIGAVPGWQEDGVVTLRVERPERRVRERRGRQRDTAFEREVAERVEPSRVAQCCVDVGAPVGTNFCKRWPYVSAAYTAPFESTTMPWTQSNSLGPHPCLPHFARMAPSVSENFRTRSSL